MASKRDIEGIARAIGRARKRLMTTDSADLFTELIAEEVAAEFPDVVAKLQRDGHGSAERIETLIDAERMQ